MLRAGLMLEAGLVPLAYGLGWLAGVDPGASLRWDMMALAQGVGATVPLVGLFALLLTLDRWGPLGRIRRTVEALLGPLMAAARPVELVALCVLAGVGEELLFRGFLQAWLARWIGSTGGLLLGGVVFGLAHAITPLYAALAGAIGVYLGWVWMALGNLLVPVVGHALYDLVALVWLMRRRGRSAHRDEASSPELFSGGDG